MFDALLSLFSTCTSNANLSNLPIPRGVTNPSPVTTTLRIASRMTLDDTVGEFEDALC